MDIDLFRRRYVSRRPVHDTSTILNRCTDEQQDHATAGIRSAGRVQRPPACGHHTGAGALEVRSAYPGARDCWGHLRRASACWAASQLLTLINRAATDEQMERATNHSRFYDYMADFYLSGWRPDTLATARLSEDHLCPVAGARKRGSSPCGKASGFDPSNGVTRSWPSRALAACPREDFAQSDSKIITFDRLRIANCRARVQAVVNGIASCVRK